MDITHNLEIDATAETVYKAVATQEGITGWWSKDCAVGEKVGEKSLLKFNKEGTIVQMDFQTEELISGHKVVWKCIGNANPMWIDTQLVTTITPDGNRSKVVFSHANFDDKFGGDEAFEMIKQGWNHFVGSLTSYCEKGEGQPW